MTPEACKMAVAQAVEGMNLRPAYLAERVASSLATNLQSLSKIDTELSESTQASMLNSLCMTYGVTHSSRAEKMFAFADGTAFIPVHGSLLNRFGGAYGFATGYAYIRRAHAMALNDPDVERIVFDVNSGGGEAAGCMELSEEIFLARGEKPTLAVVNSSCYSAAYAIASAADRICITPSGGAGSIGALIIHTDMSKLLSDFGITVTVVRAGEHKAEGNPFEELSASAKADLQKEVDMCRDTFVKTVARNRGVAEKIVYDTEAKCYSAEDAVALGLADEVISPQKALETFIYGKHEEVDSMPKPENQATNSAPVVDAKAEQEKGALEMKERIKGIMSCEEAKGRAEMAEHIAFNTSMSVEDAKALLNVSPRQTEAPAATAPAKPENNANFTAAMNNGEQPNIAAEPVTTTTTAAEDQNADNALLSDLKAIGYL